MDEVWVESTVRVKSLEKRVQLKRAHNSSSEGPTAKKCTARSLKYRNYTNVSRLDSPVLSKSLSR